MNWLSSMIPIAIVLIVAVSMGIGAALLGWKTIRVAQGFARFQSPRDGLDEADITLANVKLLVPVFMGGLAQSI